MEDDPEPSEPLDSVDVLHNYRWTVGLAFGHPDGYGFEMSHPSYESWTHHEEESFDLYGDQVAILIDGHTAQEDDWWLHGCAGGNTCDDCGWIREYCCCGRYCRDDFKWHVRDVELKYRITVEDQGVIEPAAFEALVRRRVRRRTALLRWAVLRRVVRARSVVVYWMGEAARKACAPGGRARKADAAAFKAEFV